MPAQVVENQIKVFRTYNNGLSADKAILQTKAEGLIMISNKRADNLLVGSDDWKNFEEAWPIHTGTMTAFTKPMIKLGSVVEYTDQESGMTWIFEVPTGVGLRSMKNALLAIEHPNYDLEMEAAKRRIVVHPQKKMIILVENFPTEDRWYKTHPETIIPVNIRSDSADQEARYLYRINQRVGLLARGGCYGGRCVDAVGGPSVPLGVLTLPLTEATESIENTAETIKVLTGQQE